MNAKNMFGAITVAIALFFLWPAVFGSWAEMKALKAALVERTQLEKERATILDQFTVEYAKLKTMNATDAGKMFAAMVPAEKSSAEIISAVEAVATATGVQVKSAQVTADVVTSSAAGSENERPYRVLSLKLEMAGSYSSLRSFIRSLEQYVRVLNITKFEISTATTVESGQMNYTISADAYFIK